jgi:secondary thiamine-phosphate synthase enzyme
VRELRVETERRTQLLDVTARVEALLESVDGSLVTLFVPHTTAGVVVQAAGEGATAVAGDIESALDRIVDEGWPWEHAHEGDANPWSHVRGALAGASVSIPLDGGRLALGARQALFLAEFDGPRERTIYVVVTR